MTGPSDQGWVIRSLGLADEVAELLYGGSRGMALADYDPEARAGHGMVDWTDDFTKAMVFKSSADALKEYRRRSRSRPLRYDGRPNRPLTAYSVEITRFQTWVAEARRA